MLKLYEIDERIVQISNEIEQFAEDNEGLIPEDLDAKLEGLQLDREAKICNIAKLVKSLNAEYDAIDAEYKRMKLRRDAVGNRIESVKRFLSCAVGSGNKYKDSVVSIYWKNTESVNVLHPEMLPQKYQKVTIEANKTAIKDDLKTGILSESENVVIEKKTSIVIR